MMNEAHVSAVLGRNQFGWKPPSRILALKMSQCFGLGFLFLRVFFFFSIKVALAGLGETKKESSISRFPQSPTARYYYSSKSAIGWYTKSPRRCHKSSIQASRLSGVFSRSFTATVCSSKTTGPIEHLQSSVHTLEMLELVRSLGFCSSSAKFGDPNREQTAGNTDQIVSFVHLLTFISTEGSPRTCFHSYVTIPWSSVLSVPLSITGSPGCTRMSMPARAIGGRSSVEEEQSKALIEAALQSLSTL